MNKFVFVDCETTGLDPVKDSIISIAVIVDDKEYYWKIQFNTPMSDGAKQVNGYTPEAWKDAVTFESIAQQLNTLWNGRIIVGHCIAKFDIPFIEQAFKRIKLKCGMGWHYVDTLCLAIEHMEESQSRALIRVAAALGQDVTRGAQCFGRCASQQDCVRETVQNETLMGVIV